MGGPLSRKRLCFSPHPSLHPEYTICTWNKAFAPVSARKWLLWVLYKLARGLWCLCESPSDQLPRGGSSCRWRLPWALSDVFLGPQSPCSSSLVPCTLSALSVITASPAQPLADSLNFSAQRSLRCLLSLGSLKGHKEREASAGSFLLD